MTTHHYALTMLAVLLAGCASEPPQTSLPVSHPASPDAIEVAYEAPPNVLALDVSAPAAPQAAPSSHDHSEHAKSAPSPQPQAAPPAKDGHAVKAIPVSAATQEQIDALSKAYLALTAMLAEDKTQGAGDQFVAIRKAAKALGEAKEPQVKAIAEKIAKATPEKAEDLQAVRKPLKEMSDAIIELVQLAPPTKKVAAVVYQAYCPHAKASWLQSVEKIANPYYGSEMLRCGKVTQKIQAAEEHKH